MSSDDPVPSAIEPGGLRLAVRLTPRGGRDLLDGIVRGIDGRPALALRVAAPPVEGKANAALVAYLAENLSLRKSDISLESGETSRLKRLHLAGDGPALAARIAAWMARRGDFTSPARSARSSPARSP